MRLQNLFLLVSWYMSTLTSIHIQMPKVAFLSPLEKKLKSVGEKIEEIFKVTVDKLPKPFNLVELDCEQSSNKNKSAASFSISNSKSLKEMDEIISNSLNSSTYTKNFNANSAEKAVLDSALALYNQTLYYNLRPIFQPLHWFGKFKDDEYDKPDALRNSFLNFLTQSCNYIHTEIFSTEWRIRESVLKFWNGTLEVAEQNPKTKQATKELGDSSLLAIDSLIKFSLQSAPKTMPSHFILKIVGTRMLIFAAENELAGIAKVLINNKADTNAKTSIFWGKTPLMFAAEKGNFEIVKFMLDNGAKADTRDWLFGRNAENFAYKNKHKELAKFINEYSKNSAKKAIVYLAPANEENNLNDNSERDMIGNDNKIDSNVAQ